MIIFAAVIELIISFILQVNGDFEWAKYGVLLAIVLILFDIDVKVRERGQVK